MADKQIAVITLGAHKELPWSAEEDPLGRTHNGWHEGMPPQDIYDVNHGIWPFTPATLMDCDHVLFVADGLVRLIVKITGVESGFLHPGTGEKWRRIIGDIVTDGPAYTKWFEQPNPSPKRYPQVRYTNA